MEQPSVFSSFGDAATEARYNLNARTLRTPFVRIYAVLFMLVALAYSIVNPLYLATEENAQLAFWLGLTLLFSGCYVGVTFWKDYARYPLIDFAVLLLIGVLVTRVNHVLFAHFIQMHASLHAVGVINQLGVTAFAAVTLAGKPKLYLLWMACNLAGWLGQVVPAQDHDAALAYASLSYFSGAAIMMAINLAVGRTSRAAFMLADSLDAERARNEELVLNMLPPAAVARIRGGQLVADSYADASVIFIDMVGFSKLTKRISPGHLVELLNGFFNHADACTREFGVEKVKTVGDAYLAIAGGNVAVGNSADAAIAFGRAVLAGLDTLREITGVSELGLRIGIHSGPVVGGVIGATRMAYDYWGDTVNIAARIEGTAPVNGIAISESTWLRATDRSSFGPASIATLKGVGDICVFRTVPDEHAASADASVEG
ncbi:adenylate/guanylate cyclase domain-containing protein [Novosphingobium sp. AAP83]|uniref:adenylate/guanylate cyclase domain-containing protein n=1 Tax=Novosphingobium sp. AAP83 TaxID=1523425 RepID=UPI0006B91002|nr:adenylate/guanylate cyclase domain-containing protein [Novosphingobium sp. AAP83]